jgi:hypothetical protein
MTTGTLEPMSKMTDWQWKETMLRGCQMTDDFLRELERPVINSALSGKRFPKLSENLPLLAKASRRDVEVLVYSADKKWWRQWGIKAGETTTKNPVGERQHGRRRRICSRRPDDGEAPRQSYIP